MTLNDIAQELGEAVAASYSGAIYTLGVEMSERLNGSGANVEVIGWVFESKGSLITTTPRATAS